MQFKWLLDASRAESELKASADTSPLLVDWLGVGYSITRAPLPRSHTLVTPSAPKLNRTWVVTYCVTQIWWCMTWHLNKPPLASCFPLGEHAMLVTELLMGMRNLMVVKENGRKEQGSQVFTLLPAISLTHWPLWMSHSRQVLSCDPVAKYWPFGWNCTTYSLFTIMTIEWMITPWAKPMKATKIMYTQV